jgi:hypothetical protein
MLRWSLLAIAFAIGACGDGERDRMSGETSDAAADAAIAPADTGTIETGAASTATPSADTGAIEAGATDAAEARGPTGAEAMGGTPRADTGAGAGATVGATALDLTPDRVRQLQAALNDDGCDAGPVDGIVGPQTRRAIDCGLEKHDLESGDHSGLYRALNLSF